MDVILYDPKDPLFPPPHEPVLDGLSKGGYELPTEEMLQAHDRSPETGQKGYRNWLCAACDWKHPVVRRVRAKKKRALDRFIAPERATSSCRKSSVSVPPLRMRITDVPRTAA